MLKSLTGLVIGLSLCATAYGQTADDCIGKYEELKAAFVVESPDVPVDCVQDGHIIALDAEGGENDIPTACLGQSEDHWHLKAKAILGAEPACIVQLLGLDPTQHPGCGTDEFRWDLPASEGAKWRNFLRNECPKQNE